MPFDGRNFGSSPNNPFDGFITGRMDHRFNVESTRPTNQNTPLFGMDGTEWRGFFFALTGILALVLGASALVLSMVGR